MDQICQLSKRVGQPSPGSVLSGSCESALVFSSAVQHLSITSSRWREREGENANHHIALVRRPSGDKCRLGKREGARVGEREGEREGWRAQAPSKSKPNIREGGESKGAHDYFNLLFGVRRIPLDKASKGRAAACQRGV